MHIADSLEDHKSSGEINTNLSILFWSIKDYKKAALYAGKGYEAGKALNDERIIVNCLFNLANAKMGEKQNDTALFLFQQVAGLSHDPVKYNYLLERTLINEAGTLTEIGRNQGAIEKYKKILRFGPKISPALLPFIYSGLGYAQLKENKLGEAETNFNRAIALGEENNGRLGLQESYQYMADLKKVQKQFAKAVYYHEKYDSLKNELTGEATQRNIHQLEIKYNAVRKDKQIADQNLIHLENPPALQVVMF